MVGAVEAPGLRVRIGRVIAALALARRDDEADEVQLRGPSNREILLLADRLPRIDVEVGDGLAR
jgi:hypothetical protein